MMQAKSRANARPIRFVQTIPILRIFDPGKAKEFYVDYLGFAVDWEHRFEPGCHFTCKFLAAISLSI